MYRLELGERDPVVCSFLYSFGISQVFTEPLEGGDKQMWLLEGLLEGAACGAR